METQNLNATLDCIKETTTFSERIITNVCTGQVSVIPLGFWEFVFIGGLVLFIIMMCFVLLAAIYDL